MNDTSYSFSRRMSIVGQLFMKQHASVINRSFSLSFKVRLTVFNNDCAKRPIRTSKQVYIWLLQPVHWHSLDSNTRSDPSCSGHQEIVRFLLRHGSDVCASDMNDSTPFARSCWTQSIPMCRSLASSSSINQSIRWKIQYTSPSS